jgi:hypothetical protein
MSVLCGEGGVIADRGYLAAQVKDLRQMLGDLVEWADNPARPFPGDAVALAGQLTWLAALLLADNDMPRGQAGEPTDHNG